LIHHQSNLRFNLIVLPIVIGITWWKVLIGFFNASYCRINLERFFQLAHVVEEKNKTITQRIREMDNIGNSPIVHHNELWCLKMQL
jgi:hypothetical protein